MTVSYRGTSVHATPPDAPAPEAPTRLRGFADEWRTALLPLHLLASAPRLLAGPRATESTVIDVPGWKAPEASMAPLRHYLRGLGHDARGWGLGTNVGDPERDAELLTRIVTDEYARTGRPVALVGWSLGGVIVREVARVAPDAVRHVVTYGTPVVGGPTFTLGARSYGRAECRRISTLIEELDRDQPIQVPITAIFTRRDKVVSWPACIDRRSPQVRHVEVRSTHLGMGLDPHVWATVAAALAS